MILDEVKSTCNSYYETKLLVNKMLGTKEYNQVISRDKLLEVYRFKVTESTIPTTIYINTEKNLIEIVKSIRCGESREMDNFIFPKLYKRLNLINVDYEWIGMKNYIVDFDSLYGKIKVVINLDNNCSELLIKSLKLLDEYNEKAYLNLKNLFESRYIC